MSSKRRMRDFQRCLKNINSFSDNQAKISAWDEDLLTWVEVLIRPTGGYYKGGTFTFKIYFEGDFPKCPPRVDCLTPIHHPNIDSTCDDYNVCLNLFEEWDDRFSLDDIIQGLLFLMYNPNVEDPLSPFFSSDMSEEELEEEIKASLKGGNPDFPENYGTEEFDEEELTKGIELILDKVSKIALKEDGLEDDTITKQNNLGSEMLENNNNEVFVCESYMPMFDVIIHTDSRLDKSDICGTVPEVHQTKSLENTTPLYKRWTQYIPRTFITTQSDILTDILLMGIEMLAR